jgi:hypothetical protein
VLAAYFHDAVYDPRGSGNEQRSAVLAEQVLRPLGAPAGLTTEVVRLVRLTTAHDPAPDDHAGALLCDADLAVLAADGPRYAAYAADVRAEYAHVDDAAFRLGRSAVLRALLERPSLYATATGRGRWEARARATSSRSSAGWRSARTTQPRRPEPRHQLARGHRLGAQREGRLPQRRGDVVVVALERASRHAEASGELVQLLVGHVADQVRPQLAPPRPDGGVHQDGHAPTLATAGPAGSSTARRTGPWRLPGRGA